MGREIEAILLERDHRVVATMDSVASRGWEDAENGSCDIAFEFSRPDQASKNIERCLHQNLPVVCGTTGWFDDYRQIGELCEGGQKTLFYASNFSLGVNIMLRLGDWLAKRMAPHGDYRPSIEEIHHAGKLDKPSGTALTLVERVLGSYPKMMGWTAEPEAEGNRIPVTSRREGKVYGIHSLEFRSSVDRISVRHEAFGRRGFAVGAVMAAEWVVENGRKGLLGMEDFLMI